MPGLAQVVLRPSVQLNAAALLLLALAVLQLATFSSEAVLATVVKLMLLAVTHRVALVVRHFGVVVVMVVLLRRVRSTHPRTLPNRMVLVAPVQRVQLRLVTLVVLLRPVLYSSSSSNKEHTWQKDKP
jgi:hypothetical protein